MLGVDPVESVLNEEMILNDLMNAIDHYFGWQILETTPIKRGWLNLKWKITTNSGQYLLKQYHKERFALYNPEDVTYAFSQQTRLFEQGLPCPKPISYHERFLLESPNKEIFMVMDYCQGNVIPPGKTSIQQIYDLGRATGKMHRLLNDGTFGGKNSPHFIIPSREERTAHWDSVWEKTNESGKFHLLGVIESQQKAMNDIKIEAFENLSCGWAHRDLWVDNILFDHKGVTAILDFDRLRYDYLQQDVARAVMSCAVEDDLNVSLAAAFMKGYSEEHAVVEGYLTTSLQLLWLMESTWWINANMDEHSVPPARFAKEMTWLAENLKDLPSLLENL